MTTLGIIGAMQVEVDLLLKAMDRKYGKTIAGSVFYEGTLENLPVVVVQCGVGKVNAAICAQILCSCFGITHLVNTGIAGSLCADLDIGDLVVSQDAMYHDVNSTAFGYPACQIPGMDVIAFAEGFYHVPVATEVGHDAEFNLRVVGREEFASFFGDECLADFLAVLVADRDVL